MSKKSSVADTKKKKQSGVLKSNLLYPYTLYWWVHGFRTEWL